MSEIVYTHKTRSGLKARIICDNAKGEYPIVALASVGDFEFSVMLHSDLREYDDTTESSYDLFEYNPWKDVAVDTPVYVSDDNISWKKYHFSHFDEKYFYVWGGGQTSWTTPHVIHYRYAKLATE
jgi:hypothetical protein